MLPEFLAKRVNGLANIKGKTEFLPLYKWLSELSKKTVKAGVPMLLIGGWTAYELYNSAMADDNPDLVEATTLGWIPTLFRRCFGNK